MKNKYLTKQEFIIVKDTDPNEDMELVNVTFDYHIADHEPSVTIRDEENEIHLFGKDAKALKEIFGNTNFIFGQ